MEEQTRDTNLSHEIPQVDVHRSPQEVGGHSRGGRHALHPLEPFDDPRIVGDGWCDDRQHARLTPHLQLDGRSECFDQLRVGSPRVIAVGTCASEGFGENE